jgi:hypothetical protein
MTVAMSLLVHGEAVRFNRGQSRGDDFDFKYMRGRDGREYPYVSSQCYKKYWRESLPGPFSPIIREKDAGGKEKNQAYTSGNPIKYLDDDLFGYMIAGATEGGDETADTDATGSAEDAKRIFEGENIKDPEALGRRLLDANPLSQFILDKTPGLREILQTPTVSTPDVQEAILNALDEAARTEDLSEVGTVKSTIQVPRRRQKPTGTDEIQQRNKKFLLRTFSKELQDKPKQATTRRTAPVRMHALVAFSGIKTAKDFQTFSRDIAYTGKNSIVNPSAQGIYSAWLRTRILIESHRIGKFYVGENMDILRDQVQNRNIEKEPNPYSREGGSTEYVELESSERTNRLRAILKALADIGNRQGPASGALHDGSLRPKAFVAGMMNCADSPFDYIWAGHNDDSMPYLDVNLLRDSIKDWEDLFAAKTIYIGLPVDAGRHSWSKAPTTGAAAAAVAPSPVAEIKTMIETELQKIGFTAVVDTPRKALLRLAQEAAL